MHVESIVSSSDPRVVFYSMKGCRDHYEFSQQNKRMLDSGQNFVAAMSFNVVKRAFLGQYQAVSVLTIDDHLEDLGAWNVGDIPVYVVSRELFEEILGAKCNKDQAIGALFDVPPRPLESYECPVLVLDDVRSADNVGVICRTAFSFGVPTVLMTTTSFSAVNMRSARTSMGGLFHLDVRVTHDLVATIEQLRQQKTVVLATSPTASMLARRSLLAPTDKWALVVGNEDSGSSAAVLAAASHSVRLPQLRGDSLSVAQAALLGLYEFHYHCLTEASLPSRGE